MALFDTRETKIVQNGTGGIANNDKEIMRICGRFQKLSRSIGKIEHGKTIHFVTNGSWALHDLLKYILQQIGPAEVKSFTWSISMPAALMLVKMIQDGMITKFYMISDATMKKWAAAAVAVLEKHCVKMSLTGNHSKGFIVSNNEWKISVISSANFSNNPRIEGGCISADPEVYKMHAEWIDRVLEKQEFVQDDLLSNVEQKTIPKNTTGISRNILFIVRGIPGAGKTTLANQIADAVFENNDYFTISGEYKFNPTEVPKAELTCFNGVRDAMENGINKIAVANVFQSAKSMEPYFKIAKVMEYLVVPIIVENRHMGKNIHGVGDESIRKMREHFEVKL